MQCFANKDKFIILAILTLAFFTFGTSLNSGFLLYDDMYNIVLNPFFLANTISKFWMEPYFGMYIPAIYSIWYGFWKVFDGQSWPFHLFNIFLHSYNTVLLFLLLRFSGTPRKIAFLCALIFEVHPLQVESVAWITEGRGLAAFSLSLSSAYIWICKKNSSPNEILAGVSQVLSLIFKPSLALTPIITIYMRLKKPVRIQHLIAPLFVLILGIISLIITRQIQSLDNNTSLNFFSRLLILLNHFGFILSKVLFPFQLVVDYGLTPNLLLKTNFWIIGLIGVFICLFLFYTFLKKSDTIGLLAFGLLILGWLPQSGLVSTGFHTYSIVADRYAYCILAFLILVLGRTIPFNKLSPWILSLSIIIFTTISFFQVKNWKDDISLFQHSVSIQENGFIAQSNLGFALLDKNKNDEALVHFGKAHDIIGLDAGPVLGAILSLTKKGDHSKSIEYAQKFLISPEFMTYNRNSVHLPKFYFALAYNYAQSRMWNEAQKYFCLSLSHSQLGPPNYGLEENIRKIENIMQEEKLQFTSCINN